ncbi:MAG: FAD-dependent monooxygenase, partial [Alphaproteobacteria bacterium]|nr:FAD-dependent monooxygenase [Alphaproteobacteria bacterium]
MLAETSRDVAHIIVGAGYAGCLLALLLKRAGYEVLVLEKAASNAITSGDRYFGIARETRILLQELGLWQQMQNQCTPIAAMHIHTPADPERAWLSLGQEDDYVIGCVIPAHLLHEVLRVAVADAGVVVLFETCIARLEQRTQRVEVTTDRGEIF